MRWLRFLSAVPQDCLLCAGVSAEGVVCAGCQGDLPAAPQSACPQCALATPLGAICGRCLTHKPHYDATIAALTYDAPADNLVQRLKYRNGIIIAPLLAEKLAQRIAKRRRDMPEEPPPDRLLAMPLHPLRLRERGYNQSLLLANALSRALHTPLWSDLIERATHTPPQAELPWKERARNIKGAFRTTGFAEGKLSGQHVAVVDDVMTTGATLNELAKVLKAAGAARVTNLVVARTLPRYS
jgi:ComF family protein